jgi:hypothetical protein
MKRHQQIRMQQSSLRNEVEQKNIEISYFVSQMAILNDVLLEVEQEMYVDYENMNNHVKMINKVLTDVFKSNTIKDTIEEDLWKQKYVNLINNWRYSPIKESAKHQLIRNINTPYKELDLRDLPNTHPFRHLRTILEIQIVIKNGFDINTNLSDTSYTLLENRVDCNDFATIEYLLDNGADVMSKTTFDRPLIEDLCLRFCKCSVLYNKTLKFILDHPRVKIDIEYLKLIIIKVNENKFEYGYTAAMRYAIIFIINNYIEKNYNCL